MFLCSAIMKHFLEYRLYIKQTNKKKCNWCCCLEGRIVNVSLATTTEGTISKYTVSITEQLSVGFRPVLIHNTWDFTSLTTWGPCLLRVLSVWFLKCVFVCMWVCEVRERVFETRWACGWLVCYFVGIVWVEIIHFSNCQRMNVCGFVGFWVNAVNLSVATMPLLFKKTIDCCMTSVASEVSELVLGLWLFISLLCLLVISHYHCLRGLQHITRKLPEACGLIWGSMPIQWTNIDRVAL